MDGAPGAPNSAGENCWRVAEALASTRRQQLAGLRRKGSPWPATTPPAPPAGSDWLAAPRRSSRRAPANGKPSTTRRECRGPSSNFCAAPPAHIDRNRRRRRRAPVYSRLTGGAGGGESRVRPRRPTSANSDSAAPAAIGHEKAATRQTAYAPLRARRPTDRRAIELPRPNTHLITLHKRRLIIYYPVSQ